MWIRHQSDIAFGKIFGVSQCPQRGAIAGNNDRFAVKNPFENLPVSLISMYGYGRFGSVIGMAGTNDGHRKATCPVG